MFITSGLLVFCDNSVFSNGCSYTDIIFQDQWQNSGTNHKLDDIIWTYSLLKDKIQANTCHEVTQGEEIYCSTNS